MHIGPQLGKQGLRQCFICKKIKKLNKTNFIANAGNKVGLSYRCRDCSASSQRLYRKTNVAAYTRHKEYWRVRERKIRETVLTHYGNRCACCGEDTYEFLAIDHINNDGKKHRQELMNGRKRKFGGGGSTTYRWIIKNNFPNNLQILCHNCNMAKSFYKACPHKR